MTGLQISIILFVLSIAGLGFMVTTVIGGKITEDQRLVDKRIDLVVDRKRQEELKKKNKKKKTKETDGETFRVSTSRMEKIADYIFEELMAANIMMKPEEFAMIWISLAGAPAVLALIFTSNPFLPVVLFIIGAAAPVMFVKSKQAKRVQEFDNQLSDALLICCNCLKSGLTFAQAMENIAQEMEAPIGSEFKRACNEMSYGTSMEEALANMVERIKSADLVLTVAAVSVQKQTGGNLSEILEVISNTIRQRIKIKAEVKAITSQGRMSGIVIGLLPLFLGMMLGVINPEYMMTFFVDPIGNILLAVSVVLEIIGFIVINKIVQIKY